MRIEEMATAFQNLSFDVGVSSDEMARELADYTNKITESYILKPTEELFTIDTTSSIVTSYYRPRRLKCVYCDCISSKDSGTCENCGAPLVEEEY